MFFQQESWAYPETTERLVDEKLDFVFRKGASHLWQVSEHVRHHKVAGKKRENRHFSSTCCHFQHAVHARIQDVLGRVKLVFHLCNIPLTLHHHAVICNPELNVSIKTILVTHCISTGFFLRPCLSPPEGVSQCGSQYSQVLHLVESQGRCEHIKKSNYLVWKKDKDFECTVLL